MNAELPGFTHREIALMALLAQHHRRGTPDVRPFKGVLTREDEERAARLSALLRLAEYLDRSRTQIVQDIKCRVQADAVQLVCYARGDASTEVWATSARWRSRPTTRSIRLLPRSRQLTTKTCGIPEIPQVF